jgi:tRNA(Ile)-lysidine synthetase-like protein
MQTDTRAYKDLYNEWFCNKTYWFEKIRDNDIYLSEKYFSIVENKLNFKNDLKLYLKEQPLSVQIGIILAYDQIPRHHNRIHEIDCNKYSQVASKVTSSLIEHLLTNTDLIQNITAYEWCFIMLPYRHIRNLRKIHKLITFFIEKHNCSGSCIEDKNIYKVYLKNTLNKIYKDVTAKYIEKQTICEIPITNCYDQWYEFQDILCNNPILPINIGSDKNPIETIFENELKHIPSKSNIIVSISGGVDSIVCLLLLRIYAKDANISCVHINYNNRSECSFEQNFVKKYCAILNIKCYTRKIWEVLREKCHKTGLRDLYEDITKKIRFDMYQQVITNEKYDSENTFIMLGHNADDCFENIITNIKSKNNYNNLKGMEKISQIDNMRFWRPLLNIRKNEIINYAHLKNIPYLKDSTPKWSMRGKIRDNVLPAMESVNTNTIDDFFNLTDHLSRSHNLIKNYVIPNILKSFTFGDKHIEGHFDKNNLLHLSTEEDVWKNIFVSEQFEIVFQRQNNSHKSIKEFLNYLTRFVTKLPTKKQKFMFKNNIFASIENKSDYILLCFFRNDH